MSRNIKMKADLIKISGFTLVRNGDLFDYPYLESIRSLLPLVDELIINVGIGEDKTLERIQELSLLPEAKNKIRYFESNWQLDQPEKKKGGQILSEQTNLALDRCTGDWCIYLQADEVLSESDLTQIQKAIQFCHSQKDIEGLLFDYIHFYGSFNVIQESRSVYRREVRVIRKASGAKSIGDAQSFRKPDYSKLQVAHSGARIYHYGWVRTPEAMREKTFFMDQLYHGAPTAENAKARIPHTGNNYQYKKIWGLKPFRGKHPLVMMKRIQSQGWNWDLQNSPWVFHWKDLKKVLLDSIEQLTGYRFFEYKSYKLVRTFKTGF